MRNRVEFIVGMDTLQVCLWNISLVHNMILVKKKKRFYLLEKVTRTKVTIIHIHVQL